MNRKPGWVCIKFRSKLGLGTIIRLYVICLSELNPSRFHPWIMYSLPVPCLDKAYVKFADWLELSLSAYSESSLINYLMPFCLSCRWFSLALESVICLLRFLTPLGMRQKKWLLTEVLLNIRKFLYIHCTLLISVILREKSFAVYMSRTWTRSNVFRLIFYWNIQALNGVRMA